MYERFFGFREKPFDMTPDPRFLYSSKEHREALAKLIYTVTERKGFMILTGDEGTGKKTIIRALLKRIEKKHQVAHIVNPALSVTDFLQSICNDLGLEVAANGKIDYIMKLHDFLLSSYHEDRTTILIIEEAQNLDTSLFEEIRLLNNLETSSQKLLQIVFVGKPEVNEHLKRAELSQLNQRVTVRHHLLPLDREETGEYIKTRMRIAAPTREDLFTEGAIHKIYEHSGGVPKLINHICDNALLIASSTDKPIIHERIIKECVSVPKLRRILRDHKTRVRKWGIIFAGRTLAYTHIIIIFIFLALVAGGVFYFLTGRDHFSTDGRFLKPSSRGKQAEVANLRSIEKEPKGDQRESIGYSSESKTELPSESPASRVAPMRDGQVDETVAQGVVRGESLEGPAERLGGQKKVSVEKPEREGTEKKPEEETISEEPLVMPVREQEGREPVEVSSGQAQEKALEKLGQSSAGTPRAVSDDFGELSVAELGDPGERVEGLEEPPGPKEADRVVGEGAVGFDESAQETQEESSKGDTQAKRLGAGSVEGGSRVEEILEEVSDGKGLRTEVGEKKHADTESEILTESLKMKGVEEAEGESLTHLRQGLLEEGRAEDLELIRTEDVRQIFAQYVKQYNERDIDSFLSLFSPGVLHNQKHGFDRMKKLYSEFFDQSRELEYQIEDMRIEIHQNVAEVKARYELNQVLRKKRRKRVFRGTVRWTLIKENGALRILTLDYQQREAHRVMGRQ